MRLPKIPCRAPGCGAVVERGYCTRHQPAAGTKRYERARGGSAERGYDWQWRRFRASFLSLAENVLCRDCGREHSTDVHHVLKLRERPDLKLDPSNCLALCHRCHSRRTLAGQ